MVTDPIPEQALETSKSTTIRRAWSVICDSTYGIYRVNGRR